MKINEENLKWAFRKLKRYIYYYNSSNYLKEKIINFENDINNGIRSFENIANVLNEIGLRKVSPLHDFNFSYCYYPKKDAFDIQSDESISVKSVNMFIDMDIMFYLNDIMFCLELYPILKSIDNNYIYGNIFDKNLDNELVKNNKLFYNHYAAYKNWQESIAKNLENSDLKDKTLIKIDFKRHFYNIRFKMNELLDKYNIDVHNPIINISINLYRLLSKIYSRNMSDFEKNKHEVILPIGLPSSNVIENILLSDMDRKIITNKKVLNYGRYVDDLLILLDGIHTEDDIPNLISVIKKEDKKYYLDVNQSLIKEKLEMNALKFEVKACRKTISIKDAISKMILPSFVERDSDNEYDKKVDIYIKRNESISRKQISKIINVYEGSSDEKKKGLVLFIDTRSDDELLNCFYLWKEIYLAYNNLPEEKERLFCRLQNIINKTEFVDPYFDKDTNATEILKKTLHYENRVSRLLSEKNNHNMFNIEFKEIDDYISTFENENKNKKEFYFPRDILVEEICMYISIHNGINFDYLDHIKILFEKVNGYKIKDNMRLNHVVQSSFQNFGYICDKRTTQKLCKEENSRIYNFKYIGEELKSKEYRNPKIAVSSISMPLEMIQISDIKCDYPKTYDLTEIKKIIKYSKNNGAYYILLPELCIPFNDTMKIISYCKKIKISIIAGLTHFFDDSTKIAKNYVVIYDDFLNLLILKEKNYYPYKEKELLVNAGYQTKEESPYYIIIDDSFIVFSSMTCYELTNIKDRALLSDKINVLFVPVYNEDTNYFSNIIQATARDLSCFVVQSNSSNYGDSRITAPTKTIKKDIVQVKGGINNYSVIGEIELLKMKEKHKLMNKMNIHYSNNNLSENEYNAVKKESKENYFKPLAAGANYYKRKENKID